MGADANVAAVREMWAAWERGDLAAILDRLDPEVEIHDQSISPDARAYRGHGGWRRQLADVAEAFGDATLTPVEILALDGNTVLTHVEVRARARASEVQVEDEYFNLSTFRDGKVVLSRDFHTRAEAVAAPPG